MKAPLQALKSPYKLRYGLPNPAFAREAIRFHQELGNSVDKYPWVKYYMIEGAKQDTVQYLEATLHDLGLPKPVLELKKVTGARGDGTVPVAGARIDGVDAKFSVEAEHGNIPNVPGAQAILTQVRHTVNKEAERQEVADMLRKYADTRMQELKYQTQASSGSSSEEGSMMDVLLLFIRGQPDEAKIKLRDEIRKRAAHLAAYGQATITIKGATPEETEQYFLVSKDFKIADYGPGSVKPSVLTAVVDSKATADAIASFQMPLAEAIGTGKLDFQGGGLRMKVAEWITKYGWKRSQPSAASGPSTTSAGPSPSTP